MRRLSTFALLPLVLMIGTGALAFLNIRPAAASAVTPADVFIRSVVTRDGALGWQQLCLPLQQALSRQKLESVAQEQKKAEAGTGLTLTSNFVGRQSLPQGGEVRVYELHAHRADGWSGQRTYRLLTAHSGCVADVQTAG